MVIMKKEYFPIATVFEGLSSTSETFNAVPRDLAIHCKFNIKALFYLDHKQAYVAVNAQPCWKISIGFK